jgi:protoporphyrinogen oxidase
MKKRIGIIGGGVTGLVAAYRLAKSGYAVTIYESNPTVGGLASGFTINGGSLERAYHHLFTTDEDIISLVDELGLSDKLTWNESSMAISSKSTLHPFNGVFDLLRFSPLRFADRLRMGLVLFYLQKTANWEKFTTITAQEWMRKWCGDRAYEVIWKPLLIGKFHNYFDKVSMAWLWARIHTRGNSRKSLFEKEKLGYFKGGFQVLINTLVDEITKLGGSIYTSCGVKRIQGGSDIYIELDSKREHFDSVIATVPSHIFGKLIAENDTITASYLDSLNSISYLGAVCYIFSSKQSLSNFYWHTVIDSDSPFIVFVQHTNFAPAADYGNEHVYYIGTYLPHDHRYFSLTDEEIISEFSRYLPRLFSEFNSTQITSQHVFKFKNAQHVVDIGYSDKIPPYQSLVKGVYLANFSQVFPEDRGTNFSVREGNKIAELVQQEFV